MAGWPKAEPGGDGVRGWWPGRGAPEGSGAAELGSVGSEYQSYGAASSPGTSHG
ncbi:hypothetical protein [Nonomuraea fuscirosea]|uniref:hypothetical protein n=1 Tax=Nonomuraea fuscirosea TaxID=1291556 RepID=UPI00341E9973